MASTITALDGSMDSTTPALVLGYETGRESQNVIHDLIGGGIAVTLIQPRPRNGTLQLFYLTEAAATAAFYLHERETKFEVTDPDRPIFSMQYVTSGSINLQLDTASRTRWVVTVGYQEVIA